MFHRHKTRETFTAINIVIIGLEVLAALALLSSLIGALALMVNTAASFPTKDDLYLFVGIGFGGIAACFLFLGMAEFLQLLLKIEYNTRGTAPKK